MTEKGKQLADWMEAAKLAIRFNRPQFFGIALAARVDDGNHFWTVYQTLTDSPIVGGVIGTLSQAKELKALGVEVKL